MFVVMKLVFKTARQNYSENASRNIHQKMSFSENINSLA